jgi:protein-tyrosine phosphatase
MISSVLVVCHANVCRSPMAEALLRRQLPGIAVSSAGMRAMVGAAADSQACSVARERALDLSAHRARDLTALQCTQADLILVMENVHRRGIEARYKFAHGRVFCISALERVPFDIEDPYGGPSDGFVRCFETLERCVAAWGERIGLLNGRANS